MNWYKKIAQINNARRLYHGTYLSLLEDIKKEGLQSPVFLTQSIDQAESFAEVAVDTEGNDKDIPEFWLDEIVILSIPIEQLDANKIEIDPYYQTEDDSHRTFIYNENIPFNLITVL